MFVALVLIAASLEPVASPSSLRKALPRLSDQVDASTFVCIGTVDEVITVPFPNGIEAGGNGFESRASTELRFARVRVERVLKGDPSTRVVFHEAWSTWACDDTRDTPGERSLFLLGPGVIAAARVEDRIRAASALGSDLILRNVGSGDGIVPILRDGEREYVVRWGWPESLRGPDGAKGWRLADVVAWIETSARFSPEAVTVHARCNEALPPGPDRGATFDLRILPDGSRRLAKWLGEAETVVVDRIDPALWIQLQSTLRHEVGSDDRVIDQASSWPARRLTIRIDERRFEFSQGRDQNLNHADEALKPVLHRALRAWAALWDVLDCPTCTDHRAVDARVLQAR